MDPAPYRCTWSSWQWQHVMVASGLPLLKSWSAQLSATFDRLLRMIMSARHQLSMSGTQCLCHSYSITTTATAKSSYQRSQYKKLIDSGRRTASMPPDCVFFQPQTYSSLTACTVRALNNKSAARPATAMFRTMVQQQPRALLIVARWPAVQEWPTEQQSWVTL